MHCYCIQDGTLKYVKKNIPIPGAEEVLVRVKAIGINRADLLQLEGLYPSPDKSDIPGLEVAGVVEGTNRRVCALVSSGAYAEYVSVPTGQLIDIEDNMEFEVAAAIPEALITSWLNLYVLGKIKAGMNVLIHGGASGIGTLAVQLALQEKCQVFATASDVNKLSLFKNFKNFHGLSFNEDFASYIKQFGGANLILDILGGQYFASNIKASSIGCHIIVIASMDGKEAKINLGSVLMKNITIIGSTLRSKSTQEKAILVQAAKTHLMPLIESHKVSPIIDSIISFNDAQDGLQRLKNRNHVGKIILTLG